MSYCPSCGYEYTAGVRVCPDCRTPLREGKALLCETCNEPVTESAQFCPHCGVLRAVPSPKHTPVMCKIHGDRPATGACVVCGKPVCESCAVRKVGKILCDDDEHVKIAFDWVAVCSASTQEEADMIRANLEGAGIEALVFSQADRVFFTTVGDLAVNEVMVPKNSLEDAKRVLIALNIPLRLSPRSRAGR